MKIGIAGCSGRMGKMLVEQVLNTSECELSGGINRKGSPSVGTDLIFQIGQKASGIYITDDAEKVFENSDVVIDFSTPETLALHAALAEKHTTALIVGTTGLTKEHMDALEKAAQKTVIVQAPNMSIGVNVLLSIVEQAAGILEESYDIEILEMHHKHKVDAPSGTALGLGEAAAKGRGVNLEDVAQKVRDGFTGERKPGDIGFATLRGGDVTGDHTVIFAGDRESVEISHKSRSRKIFADGAVKAAIWSQNAQKGQIYNMQDVLGLSK
ncbi:MAG: 4-hydroxy-tetrahydrodipicolinate reductase [Alphaproteobacteria bacterium]|nr:4-hydroxy-tetrahydrodipicolinate reductase [Alphaproteobacteria bacterium]